MKSSRIFSFVDLPIGFTAYVLLSSFFVCFLIIFEDILEQFLG